MGIRLIGAWLVTLACLAAPLSAWAQTNFDRPGGDYMSSPVPSGDPAAIGAVCWLKNTVPARVQDNCCVSGVRGAGVVEPRSAALETSIDRPGGDYKSFEIKMGEAEENCQAACAADNKCRAWTFARAGYVGKDAHCYLKKDIKPPRRKAGYISGVVR